MPVSNSRFSYIIVWELLVRVCCGQHLCSSANGSPAWKWSRLFIDEYIDGCLGGWQPSWRWSGQKLASERLETRSLIVALASVFLTRLGDNDPRSLWNTFSLYFRRMKSSSGSIIHREQSHPSCQQIIFPFDRVSDIAAFAKLCFNSEPFVKVTFIIL
jgi:hypothetical protein